MKEFTKEFIKITQPLGFIIIGIIVFSLPLFVQSILWGEHILPFDFSRIANRETWFSFIGSYLGAIGAVALGVIALVQAKKYNDSNQEFILKQQYNNNLLEYMDRLERNYAIIKNYSYGWVMRFVAKAITHDAKDDAKDNNIVLEEAEQREILIRELMEVEIMFVMDLFCFKGKESLFEDLSNYKAIAKELCEDCKKMD